MSRPIRFIVYSDIHYDRLGARCVTLEDCENIEKQVHQRVINGGFDFSIFGGDRFLRREPEDEVKTRADTLLYEMIKDRGAIPHYHLIGNHDWVSKSMKWHTSRSLDWRHEASWVEVMGAPKTFEYMMGTVDDSLNVRIHALPAGFAMDKANYQTDPNSLNILVFHDMIKGCKLDDAGKVLAEAGLSLADLDRPEFDMVLGGDIHIPQRLSFKNTQGGYVGAVLQRTRADANQDRGWMEVTATREGDKWNIQAEFVPVRGFFIKASFEVISDTTFESLVLDENAIVDTCVEVELSGSKEDVDRLASDPRWKNYEEYYKVRSLDVSRKYRVEQQEAVVDMSSSQGILDDLNVYLDSGFVDLGNLSKEKLVETVELIKGGLI